eukprot:CAMPEP_0174709114 /NCGR_PEP_ID=MMETSP1094-20130205/11177_1 /TAXON_ID=156173 /ORGANISM="Chrysochromulina brevifilum, Strain UTEX LB 985" /LENGTH=191 /DNA_ID=CAMNT_0015907761 /DNA_START=213 /DNA_END=789 /DNA_ORIENTATION=+
MTLDVPMELIYPKGGFSVHGHIRLINHQLRQLRSALALAFALDRKLILPEITCMYDKYWGPLHKGVIPGTHLWVMPIHRCPLDHYLEVGMLDPLNTLREWSFLINERTPSTIKAGVTHVALATDGADKGANEFARLQAMANNVRVLNISSSFAHVDLIAKESMLLTKKQKAALNQSLLMSQAAGAVPRGMS